MSTKDPIYRVLFFQNQKQYEIYSRYLIEDSLLGFIELEDLIFNDSSSDLVVDPNEEKMRNEFKDVKRCYIPVHTIIRIDEVQREGVATFKEVPETGSSNVSQFPRNPYLPFTELKE